MSYEDEELAEIQKRRMAQIKQESEMQRAKQQVEAQKQALLASILTEDARARLQNIKLARPEIAANLENQLIQLGQSGRLQGSKISDEQLKQILSQLLGKRREGSISFKRK